MIYVGVTNDLIRRIDEHRNGYIEGFSKKYNCKKLVYYEWFTNIESAIYREKEIKNWRREKKIKLIKEQNLQWQDLYNSIIGL